MPGGATVLSATVAGGTAVTYSWWLGDGTTASGDIVTHTYPGLGHYPAIVTATNRVSQDSVSTVVTIADIPIAGLRAANDGPTILGAPTAFVATVDAGSNVVYSWGFGDGTGGNGAVPVHTYAAAGVYTAVVTASNSAGSSLASTRVLVDEAITGLRAVNDSPTLLGRATTLTATLVSSSNVTYSWDFGDGTGSSGAMVGHVYTATGVYAVTVTATNSIRFYRDLPFILTRHDR